MATRVRNHAVPENAELLCRAIEGSEPQFRRQARRHGARPDEVEDVLQHAYELFLERFDPRYEPVAWLQTTIKREAWGLKRRAHRRHEIPICTQVDPQGPGYDLAECVPDAGRGPGELAIEHARDGQIRRGIHALKQDERTALGLFALGYSYREIGELKGWTQTKVNRCINEGRAALRGRMASSPVT